MDLSQVKSGDVMVCSGRDLFGDLIKWYTGSDASHVAIVVTLTDLPGKLFVIESREPNGVRIVPMEFYADYAGTITVASVTGYDDATMRTQLLAQAFPRLGEPYDMNEFADLMLHKQEGTVIDRNRFICSVLVDYLETALGLPLTDGELVTPAEVEKSPRLTNWRTVKA